MARVEIKKARMNFENKLAQNIKYDSKSFFAYVRSKSKARVKRGSLKDDNGRLLEKGGEVAEEFSTYCYTGEAKPGAYLLTVVQQAMVSRAQAKGAHLLTYTRQRIGRAARMQATESK